MLGRWPRPVGSARQSPHQALTVDDLCDAWVKLYASRERRSIDEPLRVIEKHIKPVLGAQLAEATTRRGVLRLIDQMTEATPIHANRTLTLLRTIYNWTKSRDMVATNATLGTKKSSEALRQRTLSEDELRTLSIGLDGHASVSRWARNADRL